MCRYLCNLARSFRESEAGQAAFELLLILPMFFIFLLFLIDMGVMMYAEVSTANAVREGARFGAVNCGDGNCATTGQTPAQRAAERSSGFLSASDITVSWTGTNRGDSVVVRADRAYSLIFFPYSIDLESCSQMRLEQRERGSVTVSNGAEC